MLQAALPSIAFPAIAYERWFGEGNALPFMTAESLVESLSLTVASPLRHL